MHNGLKKQQTSESIPSDVNQVLCQTSVVLSIYNLILNVVMDLPSML